MNKKNNVSQLKNIIFRFLENNRVNGDEFFEIRMKKGFLKEKEIIYFAKYLVGEVDIITDIYLAFNRGEAHLIFCVKNLFGGENVIADNVICHSQVCLKKIFENGVFIVDRISNLEEKINVIYKKYRIEYHRYISCFLRKEEALINNFFKTLWLEKSYFHKFYLEIQNPFSRAINVKLTLKEGDFFNQFIRFYFHFNQMMLVDNLIFRKENKWFSAWNFFGKKDMFLKNHEAIFEEMIDTFPIQLRNVPAITSNFEGSNLPEMIINSFVISFRDGYFDLLTKKFYIYNFRNDVINCLCYNKTTFNQFFLVYKEKLEFFSDMIRLIKEIIIVKNGIQIIFKENVSHKTEIKFIILDGINHLEDKCNIKFWNKMMFWDSFVFDCNTNYHFVGDSEVLKVFFIKMLLINDGFTFIS